MAKRIVVTLYGQNHLRPDWRVDLEGQRSLRFFADLAAELATFGIELSMTRNDEFVIDIASYADLLNSVRISCPSDGFSNKCIGHIIEKSQNLDLFEDIRRAVNRVAFAPETVPPDDQNRRVCHNCGCGC